MTLCGVSVVDRPFFFDVKGRSTCPACDSAVAGLLVKDEIFQTAVVRSIRYGLAVGGLVGLLVGVALGWWLA
jgi:hypothetical protein